MLRTDLDPVPRAAAASNLRALLRPLNGPGDYAVWSQVQSFDGSAHCGDVVAARTLPDARLAFVVVDFIGGGAPRSRRAFALATDLFALLALGESPQSAMRFADAALQRSGWEDGLPPLATVFAGFADPSNETLTYVAAAHETALLLAPAGTHRHLPATGPVAGLFETALFSEAEVPFRRGESLVVVTDGIPDSRDADGVFFGSAGTIRAATRALRGGHDPAEALIAGALRHGAGANDAAALVVRRTETIT